MVNFNFKALDVQSTVKSMVSLSPFFLLLLCFLDNGLFGLFEGSYYFGVAKEVVKQPWLALVFAIFFPLILEVGQFSFMLGTIHSYLNQKAPQPNGKWLNVNTALIKAIFGLACTGFLVWFKLSELSHMVDFWNAGRNSDLIRSALWMNAILGFVLEIRIIMIMEK